MCTGLQIKLIGLSPEKLLHHMETEQHIHGGWWMSRKSRQMISTFPFKSLCIFCVWCIYSPSLLDLSIKVMFPSHSSLQLTISLKLWDHGCYHERRDWRVRCMLTFLTLSLFVNLMDGICYVFQSLPITGFSLSSGVSSSKCGVDFLWCTLYANRPLWTFWAWITFINSRSSKLVLLLAMLAACSRNVSLLDWNVSTKSLLDINSPRRMNPRILEFVSTSGWIVRILVIP